jgi:uncharacterized protein YndB with AHSA1/START domain
MEYGRSFHFAVPPAVLWSAIEHVEQFEHWWGWLGSFRMEGDGLREGSVLRGTVAPPLPYRMSVQVELVRCDPCHLIDAKVTGDLQGDAHLRLRTGDSDGEATITDVAWSVEMMQRPMRWAARVAYPLLRWGHDLVVEATVDSFRSQLARLSSTPPSSQPPP